MGTIHIAMANIRSSKHNIPHTSGNRRPIRMDDSKKRTQRNAPNKFKHTIRRRITRSVMDK